MPSLPPDPLGGESDSESILPFECCDDSETEEQATFPLSGRTSPQATLDFLVNEELNAESGAAVEVDMKHFQEDELISLSIGAADDQKQSERDSESSMPSVKLHTKCIPDTARPFSQTKTFRRNTGNSAVVITTSGVHIPKFNLDLLTKSDTALSQTQTSRVSPTTCNSIVGESSPRWLASPRTPRSLARMYELEQRFAGLVLPSSSKSPRQMESSDEISSRLVQNKPNMNGRLVPASDSSKVNALLDEPADWDIKLCQAEFGVLGQLVPSYGSAAKGDAPSSSSCCSDQKLGKIPAGWKESTEEYEYGEFPEQRSKFREDLKKKTPQVESSVYLPQVSEFTARQQMCPTLVECGTATLIPKCEAAKFNSKNSSEVNVTRGLSCFSVQYRACTQVQSPLEPGWLQPRKHQRDQLASSPATDAYCQVDTWQVNDGKLNFTLQQTGNATDDSKTHAFAISGAGTASESGTGDDKGQSRYGLLSSEIHKHSSDGIKLSCENHYKCKNKECQIEKHQVWTAENRVEDSHENLGKATPVKCDNNGTGSSLVATTKSIIIMQQRDSDTSVEEQKAAQHRRLVKRESERRFMHAQLMSRAKAQATTASIAHATTESISDTCSYEAQTILCSKQIPVIEQLFLSLSTKANHDGGPGTIKASDNLHKSSLKESANALLISKARADSLERMLNTEVEKRNGTEDRCAQALSEAAECRQQVFLLENKLQALVDADHQTQLGFIKMKVENEKLGRDLALMRSELASSKHYTAILEKHIKSWLEQRHVQGNPLDQSIAWALNGLGQNADHGSVFEKKYHVIDPSASSKMGIDPSASSKMGGKKGDAFMVRDIRNSDELVQSCVNECVISTSPVEKKFSASQWLNPAWSETDCRLAESESCPRYKTDADAVGPGLNRLCADRMDTRSQDVEQDDVSMSRKVEYEMRGAARSHELSSRLASLSQLCAHLECRIASRPQGDEVVKRSDCVRGDEEVRSPVLEGPGAGCQIRSRDTQTVGHEHEEAAALRRAVATLEDDIRRAHEARRTAEARLKQLEERATQAEQAMKHVGFLAGVLQSSRSLDRHVAAHLGLDKPQRGRDQDGQGCWDGRERVLTLRSQDSVETGLVPDGSGPALAADALKRSEADAWSRIQLASCTLESECAKTKLRLCGDKFQESMNILEALLASVKLIPPGTSLMIVLLCFA